jgi:nitrogen PTS system EIIA component
MISVKEAAEFLNVSEKTIYRWISQSDLPVYKVKDQYRISRADLIEWSSTKKIQISEKIFEEPQYQNSVLPSLHEALQAGGIFYRVGGKDREGVLKASIQQMRFPEEVDLDFLTRMILAREELASTAIGDGIAIPHLRAPVVLHITKPMVSIAFLENKVDFNALDKKPVRVLFTIVSPSIRSHLHLLGRLGFVLKDAGFKAAVIQETGREEIFEALKSAENKLSKAI